MPDAYVNLKIKEGPPFNTEGVGVPYVERFWLKDHSETYKGCRPLEDWEVVKVKKAFWEENKESYAPFLEITDRPHTRELYILGDWKKGSKFYSSSENDPEKEKRNDTQKRLGISSTEEKMNELMAANRALMKQLEKMQAEQQKAGK